jgi:hypothetical protein
MMIVPGIIGSIPPSAPATFYLPVTAGLHRAWSFRRLQAAYTGPCLRARRTSDNVQQDINFSLGVMNAASLSAFLAGSDGRLHTLYDQAGAINLQQTALLQQPRIATSGTPVTGLNNRHGYIQVAANTEHILSGTDTSLASFTAFAVGSDMSGGNGGLYAGITNSGFRTSYLDGFLRYQLRIHNAAGSDIYTLNLDTLSPSPLTKYVCYLSWDNVTKDYAAGGFRPTQGTWFQDAANIPAGNRVTGSIVYGAWMNTLSQFLNGKFHEAFVYNRKLTSTEINDTIANLTSFYAI